MVLTLLVSTLAILGTTVAQATIPNIQKVTSSQWAALNSSVGGRLHIGRPLAAPCYSRYNGARNTQVNLTACKAIQKGKSDSSVLVDYIGGFQESQWAGCSTTGDKCPLSFALPIDPINPLLGDCRQGQVANYYIAVAGKEDVQAGLAFAQKHDVPIVIKNTGHDYKGRSAAPNSLALWTHTYQPPLYVTKNFKPAGCRSSVGDTITWGAGQGFEGIFQFANKTGYMVVGGSSTTVGAAGGWITGGGHSALSPTYGLGVDNVQQLTAVLPNGTYVVANRCQNKDIFYALRGGGGGTFGVIMEMTSTAHPAVPLQVATFTFSTLSASSLRQLLALLVENGPRWHDEGWGGYLNPAVFTTTISALTLITPILNTTAATDSMAPLFAFAKSLAHPGTGNVTQFATFYDVFVARLAGLQTINNVGEIIGSRLVPRATLENDADALVDVLAGFAADTGVSHGVFLPIFICATTPNPKFVTDDGSSSVTPAWRNSTWHVITATTFPNTAPPATIAGHFQLMTERVQPLRELTPGSGAYQNEADVYEPDAVGAFWGRENYERLLGIKKRVDPRNVLSCRGCVGWEEGDERWGCYPDLGGSG